MQMSLYCLLGPCRFLGVLPSLPPSALPLDLQVCCGPIERILLLLPRMPERPYICYDRQSMGIVEKTWACRNPGILWVRLMINITHGQILFFLKSSFSPLELPFFAGEISIFPA